MRSVGEAHFRTATVRLHGGILRSTFGDGVVNDYYVNWATDDLAYQDIARWAGYGEDWVRYGIEHDLAHHVLADFLGWRWSFSLHDNPPQPWPEHISWEEHLANALQRKMTLNVEDPCGVLDRVYKDGMIDLLRERAAAL